MSSLVAPDLRLARVEDITPELLASRGITALLLDFDNTLVARHATEPTPEVLAWIQRMKQAGITCCLLSNNWHRHVLDHAAALDLPVVWRACKPLPVAFIRSLAIIGAKRASTAMVGDQLFTDVLGARLVVMQSILVEPLSSVDLWYTRLFRRLERRIHGSAR